MNLNNSKFQSATLASILQIEELKIKFDTPTISNSLALIVGDYVETLILQQFNYFITQGYGVILKGIRWIYKSIRELIIDAFPILSPWQIGKAIASLVEKGFLIREHLFKEHHGHNFHPKNRTYYYTVNYDKIAETVEKFCFSVSPKTVSGETEKQFSDCPKNKTKNTSTENNQRLDPPSTPPEESVDFWAEEKIAEEVLAKEEEVNCSVSTDELKENSLSDTKVLEKEINSARVDKKIKVDQKIKSKPKTPKGTKPRRKDAAPWKDEGEFKRFWRELVKALPIVANSHSPQGLAQTIIKQLKSGIPHTYWDDFKEGRAIGASTMPEWEFSPGEPYPMFIEYLTEKIKAGNNTQSDEQARNEVFRILSSPRQAKAFWGQFKRSVVNASERVERDRALGVSNPYTPIWTRERVEPTLEEAMKAGEIVTAASNHKQLASSAEPKSIGDSVGEREAALPDLASSLKQMPVAEPPKESKKEKTHVNQMNVSEINNCLQDPIMRIELTRQLMRTDLYELETDELGQIIRVKKKVE